jgi:hypothetical protein
MRKFLPLLVLACAASCDSPSGHSSSPDPHEDVDIPNDGAGLADATDDLLFDCRSAACIEQFVCMDEFSWEFPATQGHACDSDELMRCGDRWAPVGTDCCHKECHCEFERTCSGGCVGNVFSDSCCAEDPACVQGPGSMQSCCEGFGECRNPESLASRRRLVQMELERGGCPDGEVCLPEWFAVHPETNDWAGPWPACKPSFDKDGSVGGRCLPRCASTATDWAREVSSDPDLGIYPAIAQDDCADGLLCIPCGYAVPEGASLTGVCWQDSID